MAANPDLRDLLAAWPFDPRKNTRLVDCPDGRQVLQARTPVGIEQYELDGRPDGARPQGAESVLDYYRQQLARAEAAGQGEKFALKPADCAELFDEGTLYYFRYLYLFQLRDWPRVIRDTKRNLGLFDFVREHARREEDRQHLEQWRPYLLRMHGMARAMQEWDAQRHRAAVRLVRATLAQIEALPDLELETFQVERQRSLEALRELEQEIEKSQPLSVAEKLERDLRRAVDAQEFERAAELRDHLRALRDKNR